MAAVDFSILFDSFRDIKVGVIGDVMLDTYWWGHVDRISPEAPVPIVALDKKETRIGGAGNVALNLVSLGAKTTILSVTGKDDTGDALSGMFTNSGIDSSYLVVADDRPTTNKTRIMSRNQQMMRLDAETTKDLSKAQEDLLIDKVKQYIEREQPAVIIFEDYNKGVLTERVIREVINLCNAKDIITTVDPKRKNFFAYNGVTVFKPNLKEVKEGLNLLIDSINPGTLQHIHSLLEEQLNHHISFITLSEKGVFYQDDKKGDIIPSHVRNIADVSGAGDTVIAVASLVYAATKDVALMAAIANIAGGLVCEEVGTAAIDRDRLLHECTALLK